MDKIFISSSKGFKDESINRVKAIAFDIISEDLDLWGRTGEQAKQTCTFIDGVADFARHLINMIEEDSEEE